MLIDTYAFSPLTPPPPAPIPSGWDDVFDDPKMGWSRWAHSFHAFSLNSGLFYLKVWGGGGGMGRKRQKGGTEGRGGSTNRDRAGEGGWDAGRGQSGQRACWRQQGAHAQYPYPHLIHTYPHFPLRQANERGIGLMDRITARLMAAQLWDQVGLKCGFKCGEVWRSDTCAPFRAPGRT